MRRLRANPAWQLIPLERLSPAERARLGASLAPDTYGVLVSRAGGRAKLVGPDTALLFLTLGDPMPIPAWVNGAFGPDAGDAVAELVADGILEAEIEGTWASGALAFRRPAAAPLGTGQGGARPISLRALQMAAGLDAADEDELASFLYRYGTVPIEPARASQWSHADSVREELALDRIGPPLALSDNRAWWMMAGATAPGGGPTPKLYAGIALGALAAALRRVAAIWQENRAGAPAFKIGASAGELHRPDRLVFYPASETAATEWGERLAAAFAGLPAAPVPFTAALDPEGLVSLGADPPRAGTGWWGEDTSWRGMVTRLLARALVAARAEGDREPWHYALERLRLAGIDPQTWLPIEGWWRLRG